MVVTISNLSGEKERVSLPKPFFETKAQGQSDFTGVWITGLYYGKKTGRMFAETQSNWLDNKGYCIGTTYSELDRSDFLHYCQKVNVKVPEVFDKTHAVEV